MQKRRPNTFKTKYFAWKRLHCLSFAASAKKCSKWPQKAPWNDPQILKNGTGGFPKVMPKTSKKNDTQKMQKNTIRNQKWPKIAPNTGLSNLAFWSFFGTCFQDGAKRPLGSPMEPQNHEKSLKNKISASLFCMCFWNCFSICGLARENAHTVRADCLGMLFGGAAMTRRRRVRQFKKTPLHFQNYYLGNRCKQYK